MPICKLTEKSLCPIVNRIWVRVGTIILKVQYLQLTINVESIPHRHVDNFFFVWVGGRVEGILLNKSGTRSL